ncbi:CaiB/BaiF CoA transferase family protein [Burkholderia sola]|uniref:CaiB/BaiF CoA transferase family protein n=1 Tax=Burkholderia sola TaxID=2843302 RepID=UPI0023DDCA94|nr:CaiB/BaiF CoA-transferase family protein [Burkholderia sola]MDF3084386.1 CoA transferase [Burkholderia sola]
MGVLDGIKVIEIASSAPVSVCAMLLADMGAEVIVVEPPDARPVLPRPEDICNRGKRSIVLDLSQLDHVDVLLTLLDSADVFIEGLGPGVAEAGRFGPEVCLARRGSLVYGRSSGWGQHDQLTQVPAPGGNAEAISGALWTATAPNLRPTPHAGLVDVVGGGALYLAIGVLAAAVRAREDGHGQIVDAAVVDGAAHLQNLMMVALPARGGFENIRPAANESFVMRSYRCADGEWINISAIEPRFYLALLNKLGLSNDEQFVTGLEDKQAWDELAARLESIFASRSRSAWCGLLEGTDACAAPVLSPWDAARHPHNAARGLYATVDGVLQVVATPRFSATPSAPPRRVPLRGEHTNDVLQAVGRSGS